MTREIGDIIGMVRSRPDETFALATLVNTHGSSYRLPGARMLVARDGRSVGSLSGGCLEQEVIERAREVLQSGMPSLMRFDTRQRFGCHGEIEILVERADPKVLDQLSEFHSSRRIARLLTPNDLRAADGGTRLIPNDEIVTGSAFVQDVTPTVQLVVVGDGPDCAALSRLAETLGWTLHAVQNVSELSGAFDAWTAVLVKTHNYGRDFAALRFFLPLNLPYVGLLGPRRRREQLLGDLLDTGIQGSETLYSPAGHDLGGDSPESIALSVIAEIHAVFAGRTGNHLRELRVPIHPARSNVPVVLAAPGARPAGP